MKVLTHQDQAFELDSMGSVLADALHYAIFDAGDKSGGDYYFPSLMTTESFANHGLVFDIAGHAVMLPEEWSIVVGDPETGDIELIAVDEILTRNFHAFVFNPLSCSMHHFMKISAQDMFMNCQWVVPSLSHHALLLVPMTAGTAPLCCLILNHRDQKRMPALVLDQLI